AWRRFLPLWPRYSPPRFWFRRRQVGSNLGWGQVGGGPIREGETGRLRPRAAQAPRSSTGPAPSTSRDRAHGDRDTAGDATYLIGHGEGLIGQGYQRDSAGEGVHAVVAADAGGERVVDGQYHVGVGVRGREGDRALIVRVDLPVTVHGRDRD